VKYELGISVFPGIVFGVRSFSPDHNYGYSEHQIYLLCFCIFLIIEKVEE
jgi:hypothetical protein